MRHELKIPPTADGSLAVTIGNWLVQIGDPVRTGQDLLEASTEKITLYVTAPTGGTLVETLVTKGAKVTVGTLVGIVEGE